MATSLKSTRVTATPTQPSSQPKMVIKEANLPKLQQQTQNRDPVVGEELEAISAAANSAAVWALQNLSPTNMSDFIPDSGYVLRVSPLRPQSARAWGRSSNGQRSVPMGDWMGYVRSQSPLPAVASLSPKHHDRGTERYLIRTDSHNNREYVCIPGSAGGKTAEEGRHHRNSNPTTAAATNTNTNTNTKCEHCACVAGTRATKLAIAAGELNPLAPRTLCHFHGFFMATGRTLTRCEQLALAQLDSDGVSWAPRQTGVFVALLKRRLGQLALLAGSEALPSLTAAQSRVVGSKSSSLLGYSWFLFFVFSLACCGWSSGVGGPMRLAESSLLLSRPPLEPLACSLLL